MSLIYYNEQPHVFAKDPKRHYYKTVNVPVEYTDWVQPTLTNNGILGGNSFAVSCDSVFESWQPWLAFRNMYSATEYFHSGYGQPHWITIYNPKPLKVSSIKIQNRGIDGSCLLNYEIRVSNDNNIWVSIKSGTMTNTALGAENTVTISTQNHYRYWQIRSLSCIGGNNDYWASSRITIVAQELVHESYTYEMEVSENDDYDRYEDVPDYEHIKSKLLIEPTITTPTLPSNIPWVQPVLTGETGAIGGAEFAVTESDYFVDATGSGEPPQKAWYMFSNTDHEWQINAVDLNTWQWMIFYNPQHLVLESLKIAPSQEVYFPAQVEVVASNNRSTWESIGSYVCPSNVTFGVYYEIPLNSNAIKGFRYFSIRVLPRTTVSIMIRRVQITARYANENDTIPN